MVPETRRLRLGDAEMRLHVRAEHRTALVQEHPYQRGELGVAIMNESPLESRLSHAHLPDTQPLRGTTVAAEA